MILEAVLVLIITCIFYLAKKWHEFDTHFKRKNIKYSRPVPIVGNALPVVLGKKSFGQLVDEFYDKFKCEEIFGFYQFLIRSYVIRNPEYVDKIMIKDFSHFVDRNKPLGPIENPENASLFSLTGNTWRAVRYKFTPLFTSGKLKFMYHSIKECGKTLTDILDKNDGKEVEINEIMSQFAMDVIGSCAYGMDVNVLQNPDSKFRNAGRKLFYTSFIGNLKIVFLMLAPKLAHALGITGFFNRNIIDYYCGVLTGALEHRKKTGLERNDFVQMLLQLKEKGKIEVKIHDKNDDYLQMDKIDHDEMFELQFTDTILIGGAFTFLTAGFHASAMALTFTLYELSIHPEIAQKVREEIKEKTHGDDLTYDNLKTMVYLENVIKESMRLYPAVAVLSRLCTKEYTFPNGFTIMPGEQVLLPVSSLHKDPAYFPDPLTFNPDRFNDDPIPGTYLPFGDGPRVCIAMRFAMLELKFALAKLLSNYTLKLSENTKSPLEIEPKSFLTTPKGPVNIYLKKIDNQSNP